MAAVVQSLLGDCEHLLDKDVRALFDRALHDWRALPVEEAHELALRARTWDGQEPDGLVERMALVHAMGIELRKGRRPGFDVLRDAASAAFGDKPAAEYTALERKAIASVLARICDRGSTRIPEPGAQRPSPPGTWRLC